MRPSTYRYSGIGLFAAVLVGVLMGWSYPARAVETVTYYHLDALGSPVAATDAVGNVVWREAYRPYGARINVEPAAADQSRWYTGHPHDEDSGLTYAGARYYDPVVGRFMGVDPVGMGEGNIHSFNRYAYGNNNPYKFVDPDGEVAQAIAGGFWGGLVDVATQGVLIATGAQESFSYTQFATSVGTGALTAGLSTAGNIAKLGNALTKLRTGRNVTKGAGNKFPTKADDLLSELPRDAKGRIYPSDKIRIRPEQHPLKPGETYAPRHHGQHYHVETRADPTKSWNNKKNVTKIKPPGYKPGQGTGFLPGEKFPGAN